MKAVHYLTPDGRDPFQRWFDSLKDRRAKVMALRRIDRASQGNFGDHKPCRDGVSEMRLDVGPGYRIYYFLHEGPRQGVPQPKAVQVDSASSTVD